MATLNDGDPRVQMSYLELRLAEKSRSPTTPRVQIRDSIGLTDTHILGWRDVTAKKHVCVDVPPRP
jgi:hypothetical protein